MKTKNNFFSQYNTQRNRAIIWSVIVLIVLAFMANLGAIIDSIVHPEIDYFDIEHLISGLVTAFVVGIMFVMVIIYIERLKKAIRERNRMDESLKISEQNYRTIFNFATEAIFIHELPTGKIIDVNDTMLKLYGYSSKEEVLSCTIADLSVNVKPYTEEDAQKYILKTINEGPQTFEWKSRRKDGSSFWIEMIVKKTDIGGEERILAVGRDITERKRVKESLIVSESNLQSFINNRNESIWSLNTTYHLIICNEYFKNAYFAAYNVELQAGINLLSILSPELLEFWKPKYDAALAGKKISFEFKETIQGTLFYFDVFLNPILSGEKIIGVSAISIDISQLKSAEKTLRASEAQQRFTLESLPVAVYTAPVDADRDATWISGDVKKITGFNSEEYIAENDFWRKRLHPEDKDRVLHAYAEKPSTREMILEYRWKCKDGQYYWFQDRSVLVENESRKEYLGIIVDITERKKAEELAAESELSYRGLFNSVSDAIYVLDAEGRFLDVNEGAEKMYGYSREEIIGKSPDYLSAPGRNKMDEITDALKRSLNGEPQQFEFFGKRKNGEIFLKEVRLNKGVYFGKDIVVALGQDISERKHLEKALQENEARYRNIVENLHQAYYEADSRAIFTYCNPELIIFSGYTKQELYGMSSVRIVADEHRDHVTKTYDRCKKEKRTKMSLEFVVQKKNGEKFWVELTTHFEFDEHGRFIKSGNIIRDIRERKLAEENLRESEIFFRSVWEHAVGGMRLTDEHGTVVTANKAYCDMAGKTAKEIVGSNFSIIYTEKEQSRITQKHKEQFLAKTVAPFVERELLLWNGKKVWFEVLNSFIEFGESKILLLGIFTDITERKKSEQIIRDLQRRESIGVLAGGIAHDFNNLLAVMMGNVSLAKIRMPADHPSVKNLDRTMMAVERAATLTKQMLAYSGKGRFQIIAIDLVNVVQEHLNLFEASLSKNVTCVTHLSPTPVIVKGDPGQIEQIVMNLIINGGEAIGEKQGIVNITVSTVTMSDEELIPFGKLNNQELKKGEYALFQVTDNGSGMNEETITKIFDPFFTTKFIGRGLGLSAVLGIIRGHGGGITVSSAEGAGTTFRVILPLHNVAIDALQPKKQSTEPIGHSPTVMVIDDEQYIVDLAFEIFNEEKYLYFSATDPEKGVQLYKEHWQTIEVVILDYGMPKMNGKEVLIELKKINPTVKVIMQSGYSEDELNHLMGDVKPSAFIQKPYSPKALVSLTTKTLRGT